MATLFLPAVEALEAFAAVPGILHTSMAVRTVRKVEEVGNQLARKGSKLEHIDLECSGLAY